MIPLVKHSFSNRLKTSMARKKTTDEEFGDPAEAGSEPALETAMAELAQIVASLESGQEPLDQSLLRFERGMALLRVCHRRLDQAAQRIEIVTRIGASGTPETAPFDGRATMAKDSQSVTQSRRKNRDNDEHADDPDNQLPF